MKKTLCLLLAVLLMIPAAGWTACARDTADEVVRDAAGINMEKGDTVTLHFQELSERCNKPVPKGGHLEWYWAYYGGKGDFSLSDDQKRCTVRASKAGTLVLQCDVYNAQGRNISSDGIVFYISSPFYRVINTVTLGLYGSIRLSFWRLMASLTLLPIHDIT